MTKLEKFQSIKLDGNLLSNLQILPKIVERLKYVLKIWESTLYL